MASRSELVEGFVSSVGSAVRGFFARSPEMAAAELKRGGMPAIERAGLPFSLTSQYGSDSLSEHLKIDQDLQSRFADYDEMDEFPAISSAYDIYGDDTTMPDLEEGKSVWVTSENRELQKELDEVIHKRCLIEDDIWGLARTLSKYGNAYGELLVAEQGLVGINYLPPPTMRRVESPSSQLIGFMQDVRGEFNISMEDFYSLAKNRGEGMGRGRGPGELTVFEDWEIIHWRLRGKHMRSVYGHGIADSARWAWKRLSLLEDALLIYKLSRAPSRYAFYVDVGTLDASRGLAYVNQVKNEFKKKKFMNPLTGKLDMRYNPIAMDEDFFVPTREGKDSTRIELLQGPDYSEVDTLEYCRDNVVAGIKVPKTYLGYGGESTRAALSTEDVRFARTVMRIQRELRNGLRKACRVHLIARGADVDRYEYDIQMSVPSAILELAKLEVLSATADIAMRMQEQIPTRWILTSLYKFSEEEAENLMQEKFNELVARGMVDADIQGMLMSAQMAAQPSPEEEGGEEDGSGSGGALGGGGGYAGYAPQYASKAPPSGNRLREIRQRGLSQVMAARRKDWESEFSRKPKTRYAEDKLAEILKKDAALAKRLKSIEGLLGDIRQTSRLNAPRM